jgi:hypothetical protein
MTPELFCRSPSHNLLNDRYRTYCNVVRTWYSIFLLIRHPSSVSVYLLLSSSRMYLGGLDLTDSTRGLSQLFRFARRRLFRFARRRDNTLLRKSRNGESSRSTTRAFKSHRPGLRYQQACLDCHQIVRLDYHRIVRTAY